MDTTLTLVATCGQVRGMWGEECRGSLAGVWMRRELSLTPFSGSQSLIVAAYYDLTRHSVQRHCFKARETEAWGTGHSANRWQSRGWKPHPAASSWPRVCPCPQCLLLYLPPAPSPIALSHLLLSWPCWREEGPIHHFTGGSILKVTLAGLAVSPRQVAVQPQLDYLSLLLSETASFICRAAGVWL